MRKFESLPVGPLSVNCSILWDTDSMQAIVVDPGEDTGRIQNRLGKLGVTLEGILLTHAHFDHFGAVANLQEHWECPAFLHPGDLPLLSISDTQTSLYGMPKVRQPEVQPLAHDQVIYTLHVIHTPGHTPGGCCFLGDFEGRSVLFAGDTLFCGGVGRTDLPGGSWEDLEESIRHRLYPLNDATQVIPGHGPSTTIGAEAKGNPFVRR